MKVHYRSGALFDLEEIFQYINKRSPGGARNVIDGARRPWFPPGFADAQPGYVAEQS